MNFDHLDDAALAAMHTKHHDHPVDHIRIHLAWARRHARRGSYLRATGHLFAGLIVAGPSSLIQRYTGLAAPAFKS